MGDMRVNTGDSGPPPLQKSHNVRSGALPALSTGQSSTPSETRAVLEAHTSHHPSHAVSKASSCLQLPKPIKMVGQAAAGLVGVALFTLAKITTVVISLPTSLIGGLLAGVAVAKSSSATKVKFSDHEKTAINIASWAGRQMSTGAGSLMGYAAGDQEVGKRFQDISANLDRTTAKVFGGVGFHFGGFIGFVLGSLT